MLSSRTVRVNSDADRRLDIDSAGGGLGGGGGGGVIRLARMEAFASPYRLPRKGIGILEDLFLGEPLEVPSCSGE